MKEAQPAKCSANCRINQRGANIKKNLIAAVNIFNTVSLFMSRSLGGGFVMVGMEFQLSSGCFTRFYYVKIVALKDGNDSIVT